MTGTPAVTVAVLSHKRPEALALCLEGIARQRFQDFELIVVSDEPAPELTEPGRLALRVVAGAPPNVAVARNLALAAARAPVIAFCDDDAVPEPGWLGRLVAPFEDDRVTAAGGFVRGRNGVSFQWRGTAFDRLAEDREIALPPGAPVALFAPEPDRFIKTVGTNAAFRVSALRAIGGFDPRFAFYLDETDVNLRLAEAGGWTALVPGAEVHHAYAESARRSRRRVPRTLHQIAASKRLFLEKHAPEEARAGARARFRAAERARLDRFFLLGLISAETLHRLLAEVDAGLAALAEHQALPPLRPPPPPAPARPDAPAAPRLAVISRFGARARARATAQRLAETGAEVTLIEMRHTFRPLTVRFGADGVWVHRGGVYGRGVRSGPPVRLAGRTARVREELARIADQRQINELRDPDGRPLANP
ncbi:MAG: glycosyltransferase [Pseudomonadota bacterium]